MKGIQGSFLMMRDKRDIRPVLFKFGVVLVFSLGGILFSIFRARRIKPSKPSSPKAQDGGNNQAGHWEARTGLKNVEDHLLHKTFNSCCSASIQPAEESPRLSRSSIGNIGCNFSPRSISTNDKDAYLLPEFNDLVKEFDMSAIKATFSPRKDSENPIPNPGSGEKDAQELEIRILRNTVKTLKERERLLEIQLLEYHGIKEQETAVMELQNRLKVNNMEAKLFNLKIETLQADKKRLEEQVAEYAKVVSELEAAKTKIKILKKKLRFEAEQNKGTILALQERVVKLQNHENHALLNSDNNNLLKSQRIKELEEESIELRKYNHTLKEENSSLAQKLDYLQNLATSLLEDEQGEALKEENRILRQKNEDMTMDIERLQADRCTDIEELVYLRWINACLRYELRNYQPGSGKTIARDLSKTLSPKSEEKAKQLILEYAQKEGNGGDKGTIGTPDFDSDQWSSSQSNLTDSGDYDDSSIDLSSHSHSRLSRKSKVLGKLMNLLRGKHSHSHHHRHRKDSSLDASPRFDVSVGRSSCDLNVKSGNSSQSSSRRSLDLPRYTYIQESRSSSKGDNNVNNQVDGFRRNSSDGSSSSVSRVIGTISEDSTDLPGEEQQPDHDQEDGQKSELVKYASVLRKIPSDRRLLTSYCSF